MKRTLAFTFFVLLLCGPANAQIGRGVVTGQIRAPNGTPAAGVRVAVTEAPDANRPAQATSLMASIAQTDSNGRYRLEDIPPGRYYVVAGKIDAFTYYPGARDAAGARVVTVAAGSTITGIDFSAVPPLKVTGRIVGADGVTAVANPLRAIGLVPNRTTDLIPLTTVSALRGVSLTATISPDGVFEFSDVAPGMYTFQFPSSSGSFRVVSGALSNGTDAAAANTIRVIDRDVTGVMITFARPIPVSGRVVVEQLGPVPPFTISFVDSKYGNTFVASTGKWPQLSAQLLEGEYRMSVSGMPDGYSLKSIMVGSKDVLRSPLIIGNAPEEIVVNLGVSNPPPWFKVSGRVTGPGRQMASSGTDLVLRDKSTGLVATAALHPDGAFEFGRVLPGAYNAAFDPEPYGINAIELVVPKRDLSGVEINLPARVQVSGRVTVDHGAVPPVRISLSSLVAPATASAVTISPVSLRLAIGGDGTFSMIVPEGDYRVAVDDLRIPYAVQSFTVGAANLLAEPLKVGQRDVDNLLLALSIPVFAIKGHVYSAGADGVRLTLSDTTGLLEIRDVQPRADGVFDLPPVPSGSYRLRIDPGGTIVPVAVNGAEVTGLDLAVLRGRVIMPAGAPSPMFNVWFSSVANPLSAVTDSRPDGTFVVALPLGIHRAQPAVPPGYVLRSFGTGTMDLLEGPLKVSSDGVGELQIVLEPTSAVRISGKVVGMENATRPLVVELVRAGSFERWQAPVSADGSFEVRNVPWGYYQVGVPPELAVARTVLLEVSGAVDGVTVELPHQIAINGRVLVENGESLPDVSGMAVMTMGQEISVGASVQSGGTFSFMSHGGEQQIGIRSAPVGYDVKSVTFGTVDLLKAPLVITAEPVDIRVVLSKRR